MSRLRLWLVTVGRRASVDQIGDRAAALAYYAFLGLPAASLLAAGTFGLVAGPRAVMSTLDLLEAGLPREAVTLLDRGLTSLTDSVGASGSLIGAGGLLALWSVSGAMGALIRALNAVSRVDEMRGFLRRRLVALGLFAWLLLALVLTLGLVALAPVSSRWVGRVSDLGPSAEIVWWTAQGPILISGLLLAAAGILRLGPDRVLPGRWLSRGSAVAAGVWIASSAGFALFVSRFGSYNETWGALASVVVALTWLWLSALGLLIGAEVDATHEEDAAVRSSRPPPADHALGRGRSRVQESRDQGTWPHEGTSG